VTFAYPSFALNVFVGVLLWLFAATLLSTAPRNRSALWLGGDLALVGINFLAIGLAFVGHPREWAQVAYVASSMEGFFLLGFVLTYPYERLNRVARAGLVAAAVLGAISIVWIIERPQDVIFFFAGSGPREPGRLFVLGWQGILVPIAWIVTLFAVANAPTPTLRTRAGWAAFAFGVALVTRWPLYPGDFNLVPSIYLGGDLNRVSLTIADTVQGLVILAFLLVVALYALRYAPREGRRRARGLAVRVGAVAAMLMAVTLALQLWSLRGGIDLLKSLPYAVRWVVFAPLLLNGILRYEIVAFQGLLMRWTPRLTGIVAGWATALFVGAHYHDLGRLDASSALTALGIGALAGIVAAAALRIVLRRRGVDVSEPGAERRLELYQAALEAAYAAGEVTPERRARLERRRRAFGVTAEEARALEHAVSRRLPRERKPLTPGTEPVPGLLVDRPLGSGSEGSAFLARRYPGGEAVVVKELDSQDPQATRGLVRSWEGLRTFIHAGIPRVLDVHVIQGRPLVVLEYVAGSTLRGPLAPNEVHDVIDGALDALAALHERGLVHRDLKPEHVIVDEAGGVHLIDLGLVAPSHRQLEAGGTIAGLADLETQGLVGTLAYVPPEVARGEPATPRSDLYAIGLVAYELLVGKAAIDLRGQMLLSSLETLRDPRIDLGRVPKAWQAFLRVAFALDPAKRYESAARMRAALPAKTKERGARRGGEAAGRASPA